MSESVILCEKELFNVLYELKRHVPTILKAVKNPADITIYDLCGYTSQCSKCDIKGQKKDGVPSDKMSLCVQFVPLVGGHLTIKISNPLGEKCQCPLKKSASELNPISLRYALRKAIQSMGGHPEIMIQEQRWSKDKNKCTFDDKHRRHCEKCTFKFDLWPSPKDLLGELEECVTWSCTFRGKTYSETRVTETLAHMNEDYIESIREAGGTNCCIVF
jgi:hypothetical protein